MTALVSDAFRLEVRDQTGGGASRALRRQGRVPGIVYGGTQENVALSIDERDVAKGLNTSGFYSRIYELPIGGKKERVIVRSVQTHPVSDRPLHIDFFRVAKGARIHLTIPVHFIHEDKSPGLKRGGVLNIVLHRLDVSCSGDNIPEQIVIDLEGLDIGHSVHLDTLTLPEGVVPTHPERDNTLATIVAPSSVKSSEDEEAEAAAATAEAEPSAETAAGAPATEEPK
jgi:large subunit ribosomal protein L25